MSHSLSNDDKSLEADIDMEEPDNTPQGTKTDKIT